MRVARISSIRRPSDTCQRPSSALPCPPRVDRTIHARARGRAPSPPAPAGARPTTPAACSTRAPGWRPAATPPPRRRSPPARRRPPPPAPRAGDRHQLGARHDAHLEIDRHHDAHLEIDRHHDAHLEIDQGAADDDQLRHHAAAAPGDHHQIGADRSPAAGAPHGGDVDQVRDHDAGEILAELAAARGPDRAGVGGAR